MLMVLMHYYGGHPDLSLSVCVAGRRDSRGNSIIGLRKRRKYQVMKSGVLILYLI